jgi:hypothetical protein
MELRTTPQPPDAWLAIYKSAYGADRVRAILMSPTDSQITNLQEEARKLGPDIAILEIVRDSPSLKVVHSGISIYNSACLTARDNWFNRYPTILAPHIESPRRTRVFTFSPGEASDPLQTQKSSKQGPFPLGKGKAWPMCILCGTQMGFLGLLDFRNSTLVSAPNGSLVFHACEQCGIEESHSAAWVLATDGFEIVGRQKTSAVLIGSAWETTDFLTPFIYPEEISNDTLFVQERGIYQNFVCFGDKIGGHIYWIQGDCTPKDSHGRPMRFIGQFTESNDVEIGDHGLAYIFYSAETNETEIVIQGF